MGHEENGVLAKKSAVKEREDEGTSRGVDCLFGGGEGKSATTGLEKNAAVLDTGGLDGESKGEPKNALVLELEEGGEDDSGAEEYE